MSWQESNNVEGRGDVGSVEGPAAGAGRGEAKWGQAWRGRGACVGKMAALRLLRGAVRGAAVASLQRL